MPGVFEKLQSNSQPSGTSGAGGGVFSKIKQKVQSETDVINSDNLQYAQAQAAAPTVQDYAFDQSIAMNNEDRPELYAPSTIEKSRQLPVLGPVFRALDAFSTNPVVDKIAELGREFYVPGAGLANIAGLTGAAEAGVAKALPSLGNSFGGRVAQKALSEGIVGAPLGAGQSLMANPNESGADLLKNTAIGGAFGAGAGIFGKLAGAGLNSISNKYAGTKIGDAIGQLMGRDIHPQEQATQEILALPPGRGEVRYNTALERSNLPANESPIAGQGSVYNPEPLALPEGNYTPPTRLKVANGNQSLDYVMRQIKPDVEAAIEVPTRRDQLITYIQDHLQIPREEIHNMPHADLQELGQMVRQNISVYDKAVQAASKRGYDLPSLLEGKSPNIAHNVARNTQERVAGVFPENTPNIARPTSFNKQVVSNAAPMRERVGYSNAAQPKVEIVPPQRKFATSEQSKPQPLRTQKLQGPTDNLKFAQTVKDSQHTSPELVAALNEKPMTGARTSDVLNRQQATALIDKHGTEGLYSKLMSKKLNFSPSETTAAQMLAKHYSSLGGEENLSKAIDLVSKTAKGGREMGQAIQALSQWNKLDAEGALLVAERQLNRGVKDTADWQKLTVAQGAPIKEAAQRIGTAQETKSLADEVLNIVTNKRSGEALTDAEKATIKQFQDQVKQINEKTKPFLPSESPRVKKSDATIREVSKIEPKERTRDQVVSFLDAKAEKARQRLAKSRNIGIVADLNNPVFDYAIIGASKIAKGAVKLTDFTEQMVKDFGESVKPHINEVFTKATNIFRKENGLPTVQELDRVVNQAVRDARFSPEDAKQFKAWASEIGHMSNEFKAEATQDLQKAMKELGDSTLGEKIATIQTGAQLLNAVTVGRNIIGNAALITSEKINKVVAVPIDMALSKLTGERTIQFLPKVQENMFRNFMKGTGAGWEGVSPTGTLDSYGIHPNVFGKNNPLKYISKSLGASMQGFDFAAYRVAYGDVLATYGEQLGKAQGLTKAQIKEQMPKLIENLDSRIHDLADEAGRYATFQDDTLLSQGTEMLKRGLNKLTDMPLQKLAEKGMLSKKYSLEGFGAGDIVLKYAKTPANLVMRALDYSPIGFVRSIMELAPLAFNRSKFNQFQATRALSRAITGTLGLTGMGYILADAGVLTGSSSMDKDTRSIQEQSGQGAYKVNWSALGRYFSSGFDKQAAQYQKGDKLMDYAWLQPAAISVAIGVNANKAVNDRKNGSDMAGWQVAEKAILGGLQTVLENPMVQGVSSVIDAATDIIKKQDSTKLTNIGKGVPASFVPSILNQFRTATDNNQRETFSKNLLTEMGNLMANKVPGLSKNLPVSYDSLGNAREKFQGGQANTVGQYLTAFFSPAKLTEYQVSPEAKLVLDLMNQSGDANVLPRIADKNIKVSQGKNMKDLRVDLTAEQYSQLQKTVGAMVTEKLTAQSSYLSDPKRSLESKVKKVKDILTETGQKARDEIGTQMGYTKKAIR